MLCLRGSPKAWYAVCSSMYLRAQRDRHRQASEKLTFDPFPSDVPTNPFGEHRLDRQALLESSHNVPGAGCNTFLTWRDKKDLGRRV